MCLRPRDTVCISRSFFPGHHLLSHPSAQAKQRGNKCCIQGRVRGVSEENGYASLTGSAAARLCDQFKLLRRPPLLPAAQPKLCSRLLDSGRAFAPRIPNPSNFPMLRPLSSRFEPLRFFRSGVPPTVLPSPFHNRTVERDRPAKYSATGFRHRATWDECFGLSSVRPGIRVWNARTVELYTIYETY